MPAGEGARNLWIDLRGVNREIIITSQIARIPAV